jgi:hypothetical protein
MIVSVTITAIPDQTSRDLASTPKLIVEVKLFRDGKAGKNFAQTRFSSVG